MSKIKTFLNYEPEVGEINDQPDMTVPDMSMSIREIMLRYASGQPLSLNTHLHYGGDEYYPDPREMDLTDIDDLKERNALRIKELEQKRQDEIADYKAKRAARRKKLQLIENQLDKQPEKSDTAAQQGSSNANDDAS